MRVKAPEGMTSFSHDGKSYAVDSNGFAEIPEQAFAELRHHGLTHVPKAHAPIAEEKPKAPVIEEKPKAKPQLRKP